MCPAELAVCRELALSVRGEPNANEEQTRNLAEDIVAASDVLVFAPETHSEAKDVEIKEESHTLANGIAG